MSSSDALDGRIRFAGTPYDSPWLACAAGEWVFLDELHR